MNALELEGLSLGKYQVLRKLGEGIMSLVYLAQDPFIDRQVAIKVAHPERVAAAENPAAFKRMFFSEAQTAGMLRHPNITAIFDAGMDRGVYFIVMEYVHEGQTLDSCTSASSLVPLRELATILFQSAQALDYAHRRGVIHRGIKPRNILLTHNREVKLTDFGVAAVQTEGVVRPGSQAGSPLYMSPEQIRNEPLTGQSDLFSLGIVAYELLTGKHPFAGSNLEAIQHQILTRRPLPIAEYRSNVPEIYQRIIDKALAKAPYYRYTSGADLSGDIALVFDFLRRAAPDVSPQDKFSRVRALRFFKDFQDTELWEIVTAAEWTEIEAGRKIVHEGEIDPSFYVLIDGSVSVLKGQRAIIQLGAGDCFGEMALISGRRRSATIVADLPVTAVKLRASIIDHVSVSCQNKFQRSFLTALIERLETATEQISEMPLPPSGAS